LGGERAVPSLLPRAAQEDELHMYDLRREAGSRLLERGADLHTVQLFLDHANISTSSRYLKPSKLALHTTIQRIDAQRRASGEASKWEQELAEMKQICRGCHKSATNW
jgi:integrase